MILQDNAYIGINEDDSVLISISESSHPILYNEQKQKIYNILQNHHDMMAVKKWSRIMGTLFGTVGTTTIAYFIYTESIAVIVKIILTIMCGLTFIVIGILIGVLIGVFCMCN